MTEDESRDIEELLKIWHDYEASYRPNLGVPKVSISSRDYRTGEQHDTADDDREAKLRKIIAEAVAACVQELPLVYRLAISLHFRDHKAGASVHRHPRVENKHRAYQEAKAELLPKFRKRELMR